MQKEFEIMIPKTIPIIRSLGRLMIIWAVITFVLFWILMSPSDGATIEMRTGFFIIAIPESVKTALIFAAIALPVGLIVLRLTMSYVPGMLSFRETGFEIATRKSTQNFKWDDVTECRIGAGRHVFFSPHISTLVIIVGKNDREFKFLLRHYMQSTEFYEVLSDRGIKLTSIEEV